MSHIKYIIIVLYASVLLSSCGQPDGNFPGSEYMPDMAHSIALESNVYTAYSLNTWDSASVVPLSRLAYPRLPAPGTVPRGYAGLYFAQVTGNAEAMRAALNGESGLNTISVPMNGSVPFYYENTEEERTRAINEIIENPFPITEAGLAKGGELYNIFCGICHGGDAGGQGYLVSEDNANAAYPAAPANLLLDEHVNASNGRYYFAIMHGKNLMGAYKDKLGYEERWQVIHYIRSLQAKDRKLQYNANVNTLNPAFGTPVSRLEELAESRMIQAPQLQEAEGEPSSDTSSESQESHDGGH